jgi:hypothetical protein
VRLFHYTHEKDGIRATMHVVVMAASPKQAAERLLVELDGERIKGRLEEVDESVVVVYSDDSE